MRMNKQTWKRIKLAAETASGPVELFFHFGYQQLALPKWFRRLFAKKTIHRAWHSGFYGGGILSIEERYITQEHKSA